MIPEHQLRFQDPFHQFHPIPTATTSIMSQEQQDRRFIEAGQMRLEVNTALASDIRRIVEGFSVALGTEVYPRGYPYAAERLGQCKTCAENIITRCRAIEGLAVVWVEDHPGLSDELLAEHDAFDDALLALLDEAQALPLVISGLMRESNLVVGSRGM